MIQKLGMLKMSLDLNLAGQIQISKLINLSALMVVILVQMARHTLVHCGTNI